MWGKGTEKKTFSTPLVFVWKLPFMQHKIWRKKKKEKQNKFEKLLHWTFGVLYSQRIKKKTGKEEIQDDFAGVI